MKALPRHAHRHCYRPPSFVAGIVVSERRHQRRNRCGIKARVITGGHHHDVGCARPCCGPPEGIGHRHPGATTGPPVGHTTQSQQCQRWTIATLGMHVTGTGSLQGIDDTKRHWMTPNLHQRLVATHASRVATAQHHCVEGDTGQRLTQGATPP